MEKVKFSQLSQDIQLSRCSVPQCVSVTQNPDEETREQIVSRQEKFLKLQKSIKYKLASWEAGTKIQAIGQKYGFELLRLANITRLIREYYFGEVRLENFPQEIEHRMGVSPPAAQEIARYIKYEIIDWDPWAEYLATLPKVTVRELFAKYPKAAEQEITDGFLEFKDRPDDLFEPTVKNWLRDYISHVGQMGHTSIDRMKYLFYAENTQKLSSPEREKLGIIFKSFDENILLPVDVENQEIVFDISEQGTPEAAERDGRERNQKGREIQTQGLHPESFVKPYQPITTAPKAHFRAPVPPTHPSFTRPYQPTVEIPRPQPTPPVPSPQPEPTQKPTSGFRSRPVPAENVVNLAKPSALAHPAAAPPKKAEPPLPAFQNIQNSKFPRETRLARGDQIQYSDQAMQFFNPYPKPETHEIAFGAVPIPPTEPSAEPAGASQIKLKGFTEGAAGPSGPFPKPTEKKPAAPPARKTIPAPPPRPKNIIHPHNYRFFSEETPGPRINGNIVDLSGKNE